MNLAVYVGIIKGIVAPVAAVYKLIGYIEYVVAVLAEREVLTEIAARSVNVILDFAGLVSVKMIVDVIIFALGVCEFLVEFVFGRCCGYNEGTEVNRCNRATGLNVTVNGICTGLFQGNNGFAEVFGFVNVEAFAVAGFGLYKLVILAECTGNITVVAGSLALYAVKIDVLNGALVSLAALAVFENVVCPKSFNVDRVGNVNFHNVGTYIVAEFTGCIVYNKVNLLPLVVERTTVPRNFNELVNDILGRPENIEVGKLILGTADVGNNSVFAGFSKLVVTVTVAYLHLVVNALGLKVNVVNLNV